MEKITDEKLRKICIRSGKQFPRSIRAWSRKESWFMQHEIELLCKYRLERSIVL